MNTGSFSPVETASRPLRVAVDLSWLRPGGEAGGIKPFIFEYLRALTALEGTRLTLLYLTWSCSHFEVRSLAREQDQLICVRCQESDKDINADKWRSGEVLLLDPPSDLLIQLSADLQYIPLGMPQFACPGIPNIATVVDVLHRDFPATLSSKINAQRETIFEYLIQISERFQCISQYTAERLHHHFAVPLARTFRSYIPIHKRLQATTTTPAPFPLPGRYFFYPANSWKHKNHEFLLAAYKCYLSLTTSDACDLVLTGYDDQRMREILAVADALGIKERVHFLGHIADDEFAQVWKGSQALLFPSLHEGFGIPLLEAMHFGVPILTNRMGSLGEVAGNAALFADANDPEKWAAAMARIASDEALRNELVTHGRQRLTEFSFAAEVAAFRDVILNTVKDPTRRFWNKGLTPSGEINEMAILCLPQSSAKLNVSIRIGINANDGCLEVRAGITSIGFFNYSAWKTTDIRFEINSASRSLVLINATATPKPVAGSQPQPPVAIELVSAATPSGQTYNLFEVR